jgi:hypothetical protein
MEEQEYIVNIWSPTRHKDSFGQFVEKYDIQRGIITGSHRPKRIPIENRVCRFCGKKSAETEFREAAHLIPEGLGNTTHFSDVECHACNKKLGKYEQHLIKFLEPLRLLHFGTKKGNRYPVFNSPMRAASIHISTIKDTEVIVLTRPNPELDNIKFAEATNTLTLTMPLNPYSPHDLFLGLTKIGLSLIDDSEVSEYKFAYDYLLGEKEKSQLASQIAIHHLPLLIPFPPAAFLFRRKQDVPNTPKHFLVLHVYNCIFTIPLMLNTSDMNMYLNSIPFNMPPPLLYLPLSNDIGIKTTFRSFDSLENVTLEEFSFSMQMNPDELKNGAVFNPATGKITPADILQSFRNYSDTK